MLRRFNLETPFLGTVALATDKYALVGRNLSNKKKFMEKVLDVPIIEGGLLETKMIGVLAVGNSNGLLVSPKVTDLELKKLQEELPDEVKVDTVDIRTNALGNIITTNDEKALVGVEVSEENLNKIEEVLNVEVESSRFNIPQTIGSSMVVTNKGGLLNPNLDPAQISDYFGVYMEGGTSNKGVKEVGTCLIANSNGAFTGERTTGPELGTIERSLNLI